MQLFAALRGGQIEQTPRVAAADSPSRFELVTVTCIEATYALPLGILKLHRHNGRPRPASTVPQRRLFPWNAPKLYTVSIRH
jgi:hypothetical protein